MTDKTEPLLSCPFCGSESCRVIGGPGTVGGPKHWAGCDHCHGRAWGDTEAEAIFAWNTRALDAVRLNAPRWLPIESAPRDGTEILGFLPYAGVLLIRYTSAASFLTERELEAMDEEASDQEDWFCADFVAGARLEGSELPTHWQPLPAPPSKE